MRTTVTLDPDVSDALHRLMRDRDLSFKDAINVSLRSALTSAPARSFRITPANLGVPKVDLTHALRIAGDLEDAELIRRMRRKR